MFGKLSENLSARGFLPKYFDTKEEAAAYLLESIQGKTVGIGGSRTVEALDIYDRLCENNTVRWHWKDGPQVCGEASTSEVYLCSANGVTESGEIVNIDNTGNRVAATLFGPKKVYVILGRNKIAPTLEAAIDRARNIAGPMNAKRYNLQTPCAVAEEMRCYDCASPQRLCRAMVIHMYKPKGLPECEVILINEELGF